MQPTLLTNITAETAQRTNRFVQYHSGSAQDNLCGAYATPDSSAPYAAYLPIGADVAPVPHAFTPYAPAASIPRFQSGQRYSHPAPSQMATTPQQPHMHQTRPFHETPAPTVSRAHSTSPLQSMTAGPVTPVYAPSSVSPFQLFVDVVSGASLSIDDDDTFLRQSGYAMPAITVGYHNAGSMGYDGEVIGNIDGTEAATACLCLQCLSQQSSMAEPPLDASSRAPAAMPMSPQALQPSPQDVFVSVPSTPKLAAAPAASSPTMLPQPSTFSVEVRGHHGRLQTVVSHLALEKGTHVVFEGDRGLDMGVVLSTQPANSKMSTGGSTPMVVRSATADEIHEWCEELPALAAEAAEECAGVVQSMRLKMVIRGASYQLDKQKLTFFYETAEHRVDFRKLLIELFNRYRCRIWMEKYNNPDHSVGRQRR